MRIGVLTSSRADFGIYLPLLLKLIKDKSFNLEIIAFGTHLQESYGYTIKEIEDYKFPIIHKIITPVKNTCSKDISGNIAEVTSIFSTFWDENSFDLIFTLGDRYEMYAAVSAASPFNIKIAHIHAGETTLGSIDNSYRHAISLFSKILFVSTNEYLRRARCVVGNAAEAHNVGALSMDNLYNNKFYSLDEFEELFNINLRNPSILCTFQPETVSTENNKKYIKELINACYELQDRYQIIITMPNSDALGNVIRDNILKYSLENKNVKIVESFGMRGYLTCMKYSIALLGNTSSGFVEASFFPKWVINLGNRQDGRLRTPNIIDVPVVKKEVIIKSFEKILSMELPKNCNIYGDGNTASRILSIIKEYHGLE